MGQPKDDENTKHGLGTIERVERFAHDLGSRWFGQLVVFAFVGGFATAIYLGIFNLLRLGGVGPWVANTAGVAVAIVIGFVGNRRFTFPSALAGPRQRQFVEFTVVAVLTLAISNGSLAVLFGVIDEPSRLAENAAIMIATAVMFLIRFSILRTWVFHPSRVDR